MKYSAFTTGTVTLTACLLAACSTRTDVSLTGNTPAQYSHVWITTQEVWFNASASAGPDDGGWTKFPLGTPTTIDLVQNSGGSLGSIATRLKQLPGTYAQIRLIPVDPAAALTAAAKDAGAIYNAEVDYTDSAGNPQQLPLELLNPDQGIGITGSLHIAVGSIGSSAALTSALGTSSTGTNMGRTTATTGTATTSTTATSTGTTTTTSFALTLDGARDLVPFAFGTSATPAQGVLLSPHAAAYNLANVGGISGTLTLTGLSGYTAVSGLPDIQATAETLSADGSRHVALLSTPVHADGTFLLYPLPSSTSTAASYDVVIHGAGIATIIVKAVTVPLASTTTNTTTTGATTTGTTPTTTPAVTTTASSTNTVSIGTLIPRAATAYGPSITTSAASPLTADAQVGFFQTLSGSGEVPYQIEASPIDPFHQVLANAVQLSNGTIDSGTYVASGDTIALFSSTPTQGAGHYVVAASAPSFADGALQPTVSAAAPSLTLANLSASSGSTLGTLQAVVTPASPGEWDAGELLVSHNGTLVGRALLGDIAGSGGTVTVAVPSGTGAAKYYVTVRVWKASNPGGVQRQFFPSLIDMSASSTASVALTIN